MKSISYDIKFIIRRTSENACWSDYVTFTELKGLDDVAVKKLVIICTKSELIY